VIRRWLACAATTGIVAAACARSAESPADADGAPRLPTGARLDPAGRSVDVGSMPLAMALSPDGRYVVLLLNGWREQGVQVIDRATGATVQTVPQAAAFIGIAFSPNGNTLYVSGGNQDVVYDYEWKDGRATLRDSIVLAWKANTRSSGTRYPAGLGVSPDGTRLYVAENLGDSLTVVDLTTRAVLARHGTERYPYGVAVAADGAVYVSAWGGHTVSVFTPNGTGGLDDGGRIRVARHPSALALNADGSRLFVASGSTDRIAIVDTRGKRLVKQLDDPPPEGPDEGSTPNALALSHDGKRLFVAEADANSVAIFDLSALASNDTTARGNDLLAGRIPVGWYPTALALAGDTLWVVNGKGVGTAPNPDYPHPGTGTHNARPRSYTLGQISGTVTILPVAELSGRALADYTARVDLANNWTSPSPRRSSYPPIEHVVYIIKENRTYDQILGDLPQADGDTSLLFFGRDVSPNHHALAERFGIYDRFFVNAEVSADGHNWSAAAYSTDYVQKTTPSHYSDRGRSYDYEGTNRCASEQTPCEPPADDVAEPASGYLWDLAQRAGITFRNYGEFVIPEGIDPDSRMPTGYKGSKPFLAANTSREFPGYDLDIPDQRRADVFLKEFEQFVREGQMPRLIVLRLPNDHTAGARANAPTPRAYMADNDLALGRVVEAISRSPFWRSTAIFVVEDDAQNGPDHVDSHRTPFFLVSPWARPGVHHRFTNTTDVIATMEEILGLGSLSQFDFYGRPLRDVWTDTPDLAPYRALTPSVSLNERNPAQGRGARESQRLDLAFEDVAEEDLFNQILWRAIKGENVPFPGVTRMSALEWKRAR
jgi:YVTN family beta-propeller protein